MYTYTFLLGMVGAMTFQNTDLSTWDTLYSDHYQVKELAVGWKPVSNDVNDVSR
jgi:hypothetical protein